MTTMEDGRARMTLIDLIREKVAPRDRDGLTTFGPMHVLTDKYDGAAGKAIIAAYETIGPDCTEQELLRTMVAATWWVQTLVMAAMGEVAIAELKQKQAAQSEQNKEEDNCD